MILIFVYFFLIWATIYFIAKILERQFKANTQKRTSNKYQEYGRLTIMNKTIYERQLRQQIEKEVQSIYKKQLESIQRSCEQKIRQAQSNERAVLQKNGELEEKIREREIGEVKQFSKKTSIKQIEIKNKYEGQLEEMKRNYNSQIYRLNKQLQKVKQDGQNKYKSLIELKDKENRQLVDMKNQLELKCKQMSFIFEEKNRYGQLQKSGSSDSSEMDEQSQIYKPRIKKLLNSKLQRQELKKIEDMSECRSQIRSIVSQMGSKIK